MHTNTFLNFKYMYRYTGLVVHRFIRVLMSFCCLLLIDSIGCGGGGVSFRPLLVSLDLC